MRGTWFRPAESAMTPELAERYSRQIRLPEVGEAGQEVLQHARVLIIGAGGLGSPVAAYLAAAGIGSMQLVDYDVVDHSNLQRQILHGIDDVGRLKVDSAADTLRRLNPELELELCRQALDGQALDDAVAAADVVVECTDNLESRFLVNRACFTADTPLVSGGVIQFEGQVSVFDPRDPDSPCYECLYQPVAEGEGETCAGLGVLAAAPGVVGSIQATEALMLLLGLPTLVGQLLLIDLKHMDFRKIRLPKRKECAVCGCGD